MRLLSIAVAVLCLSFGTLAQTQTELDLMPMPANVQLGSGQLAVDQAFTVALDCKDDGRAQRAAQRAVDRLSKQTAIPLTYKEADAAQAKLAIRCENPGEKVQKLEEDESYKLEVTPTAAKLSAPNPLGIIHGLQTFLQLVKARPEGFSAPAVVIEDKPRFQWRGTMLDVCRHWMPIEVVKRNIDGMEAVKMNVMHWHLSEDQGFRIESKKFPKLHEMGSDGNYFTQAQAKEIIQYARDRGIRVVPEFDMPGHTTAWFVGHPELAAAPGPYQIERKWGIFDPSMDPSNEEVYKFLDKFIGEMAELFPDAFFHVGGDEVTGKPWDANPKIQEFKKANNLADNHALQAYFSERVQKIVAKHKKTMVGWDEVLHPTSPKEILIQSWRGQESLAEAATRGYRAILSRGYYIDLQFPASYHYANDPLENKAAGLTPEQQKFVLGGESCMWAEYITPFNIDARLWPRNAAVAERLWSPQNIKDVDSMYRRLAIVSDWLEWAGLNHQKVYEPMLARAAGSSNIGPLNILAETVEPVKEYGREQTREYTQFTPLNRLIDALPAESAAAREFGILVDKIVAGQATPEEKLAARHSLLMWRENDKALQPVLQNSFILKENAQHSQALAAIATVGLQALDYLDKGGAVPSTWRNDQVAYLDTLKAPKAELLLVVAPHVRKLVDKTTAQ